MLQGEQMLNRRTLLKLGTASLAATLSQVPGRALADNGLAGSPRRAVCDLRFEEGRAFASAMIGRGVPVSDVAGGIPDLWYRDLRAALLHRRLAFIGLTDRTALFTLEELARDVGMRVGGRTDHTIDHHGMASHRTTGSSAWRRAAGRLGPERGFGADIAALLAAPGAYDISPAAQKYTGPFAAAGSVTLVSWWIA